MKSNAPTFDVDACWQRISDIINGGRQKRLTHNTVERAVLEIELTLDEHVIAEPDTRALTALRRIARGIPTEYREAREVAFDIYDRAAVFYSEDNNYLLYGGAASLYEEMRLTLVNRLRALITPR